MAGLDLMRNVRGYAHGALGFRAAYFSKDPSLWQIAAGFHRPAFQVNFAAAAAKFASERYLVSPENLKQKLRGLHSLLPASLLRHALYFKRYIK